MRDSLRTCLASDMAAIAYGVILGFMMIALVHMIIADHKEHKEEQRQRAGRHRKIVREAEDKFFPRLREELKKQD